MIEGYPKIVVVQDGTQVNLRPMVAEDEQKLLEFFQRVPAEDRWYLKEDTADPEIIASWVRSLNYDRVLPIVAEVGDRIVADASLHRHPFGCWTNVAKIRIVVAPEYRGLGLGTWMILDLVSHALQLGLDRLMAELVADKQEAAIDACLSQGFVKEATLPGYVRDSEGNPQDVVMLVKYFHPDWSAF